MNINNNDENIDTVINNIKNDESTFKILDIGSSNGSNSTTQVNHIIYKIRKEIPNKTIEIYYSDLPQNDFTLLFNTINKNQIIDSCNGKQLVFSYGIGKDYENQLVPFESIDLIMSYNSLHWVPLIKEYYLYEGSFARLVNPNNRLVLSPNPDYYKTRLYKVLKLHLNELKPKCSVFNCNFLIYDENSARSMEESFFQVKEIIRAIGLRVAHQGNTLLSREEIERMVLPVIMYTIDEYDWVINKIESTSPSSLKISQSTSKFTFKDINSCNNNKPSLYLIDTILTYCGSFIKNAIQGDQTRKDSIYNEIKSKLFQEYELDPSKFEFELTFLFLSFFNE